MTQRLDYLRELGVTAIWLLPFYPSPLKDDGYDIADYFSINSIYGNLKDFRILLHEAHKRHLRVITELVVNHTSDQHPWFQRARQAAPGSTWRDYYVWSETPDRYKEARIIFRDFEHSNWSWDPVARAYYWHRFYSHQPDLNYDHPPVVREITRVLDFWFDLGVDGLRLDAVPYLFERDGTSCENLPETHDYLKLLRRHVDEKYGDRMLLAEANQWPEDAVSYFGAGRGDECHMAFHFPLMPRLFMAVRMEDRVPIVDILEQTPPIPETSQWALFLRNHDELTLEMVTDEERDYMYRVYASQSKARINLGIRRRLAPLLGNDRNRIELLHLLLLSYPGTPVLYYGDEIGMGDNIFLGDRNGVRTPMQWSSDKNAGFSRASPQALFLPIILDPEYHYEAVNVEAQQANPNSLWWWLKRVLALRKRYKAFGRGSIEFLQPDNRKILAFVRRYDGETILVVANLSRFSQPAKLDLSEFKQLTPVELFGQTAFPVIDEAPYVLTLNPHAAFWFVLERRIGLEQTSYSKDAPLLTAVEDWQEIVHETRRGALENALMAHYKSQRWFAPKAPLLRSMQIRDVVPVPSDSSGALLLILVADYTEGDPEDYLFPVSFCTGSERERVEHHAPQTVLARLLVEKTGVEGVLHDASASEVFCEAVQDAVARRRTLDGSQGELKGVAVQAVRNPARSHADGTVQTPALKAEQSNTCVILREQYFLKLFRRMEPGTNPDWEMSRFLSEKRFPHMPRLLGALDYARHNGERFTAAIVTQFVQESKAAWEYTLDALGRFFERVGAGIPDGHSRETHESMLSLARTDVPQAMAQLLGTYMESARLLGQRTADLHLVLVSDSDNRDFAPEPFTPFYQRSLFQSM
ncbi:MAG TPA: maltose alpha-D-glucosyltransferase, partial [Candidatus Dormibacteraeota bacterium]|nr:maltose alpha-D-glucosyltransferase [Candidatus Dormibacteraeota bacterium]